jgi:hypothetical protein
MVSQASLQPAKSPPASTSTPSRTVGRVRPRRALPEDGAGAPPAILSPRPRRAERLVRLSLPKALSDITFP